MAEMQGFSRFTVNLFNGPRNARAYAWLVPNLGLPPDAACLEIGCGNGDMARRIVDGLRPARYVATDLDPRQLEVARKHLASRYPGCLPPALELRAADMLSLPLEDASLDAVFAFYSLHHADAHHGDFVNVPRALAEVDRVLRPGGCLAYTEIVNRDKVRAWLTSRGFRLAALRRGWTHESVVAVKPAAAPPPQGSEPTESR